jgi:hypothetical protein
LRAQQAYRAAVDILARLSRLDDRIGIRGARPKPGQSRRDFLASIARSRLTGYVPNSVYLELVELHDRVAALEATVDQLKAGRTV